jgi:hypothetical protein
MRPGEIDRAIETTRCLQPSRSPNRSIDARETEKREQSGLGQRLESLDIGKRESTESGCCVD